MTLGTLLLGLAPSPDWVVFGIAAIFLFGVPLGIAVARPIPALTFPAMGLLALTGVGPAFVVDVPLAGRVVNLRLVDSIPAGARCRGLHRARLAHRRQPRLAGAPLRRTRQQELRRPQGSRRSSATAGRPRIRSRCGSREKPANSGRVLPSHPKFWAEARRRVRAPGRQGRLGRATAGEPRGEEARPAHGGRAADRDAGGFGREAP